jgi:hypothetical protein
VPNKPKAAEAGLHITRAGLHESRLAANLSTRTRLSPEERRRIMSGHPGLMTPMTARELLRARYLRSGRKLSNDGSETGTIGRYHHARSCLYFSDHIDGVLAEAGYYMHLHEGVKVGSFGREYRIIAVKFSELPVDITQHYAKLDLYCDCHPLQKIVEDNANTSGWSVLVAPSVRRTGKHSIVVYDITKIRDEEDVQRVRLYYDARNPSITTVMATRRRTFVVRTTLY